MMKEKAVATLILAGLLAAPAFAQGKGGDNKDDRHSGKVDRSGDGNSGQGDDLHRKSKDSEETNAWGESKKTGDYHSDKEALKEHLKQCDGHWCDCKDVEKKFKEHEEKMRKFREEHQGEGGDSSDHIRQWNDEDLRRKGPEGCECRGDKWAQMSDEQKEQYKQKMEEMRKQREEKWNQMTDEQKEMYKQKMEEMRKERENGGDCKDKWNQMTDEQKEQYKQKMEEMRKRRDEHCGCKGDQQDGGSQADGRQGDYRAVHEDNDRGGPRKVHEDNGHGNDPGHTDPSNPGKGKGNHGTKPQGGPGGRGGGRR
jgi:hypothetical protein